MLRSSALSVRVRAAPPTIFPSAHSHVLVRPAHSELNLPSPKDKGSISCHGYIDMIPLARCSEMPFTLRSCSWVAAAQVKDTSPPGGDEKRWTQTGLALIA